VTTRASRGEGYRCPVLAKLGAPFALVVVARDAGEVVGMALAEPGRLYEKAGFGPTGREQLLDSGETAIHLYRPVRPMWTQTPVAEPARHPSGSAGQTGSARSRKSSVTAANNGELNTL
jgi:hypothetical protein